MKRCLFFLLLLLLIPSYAYAQENTNIEYDRCEYDMLNQNVYAPFYFHINHDSAISQVFKQKHDDNPNVSPFVRTPDITIPDEYPTWIEFGSSVNATATYEFQVDLGYKEQVDHARPIMIQLFSQGSLIQDKKIFQEDKIGCIVFKVFATPPPHEFTYEEILQIAKSEFIGTTNQFAQRIDDNTSQLESLNNITIVLVLIFAIVVGYLIINDKARRKTMQTLKEEYDIRNSLLETALVQQKANIKLAELHMVEEKISHDSMTSTIIGNFGHMMESMHSNIKTIKKDFKEFIDQLRKESEIPEPIKEFVETTFAKLEDNDLGGDSFTVKDVDAVMIPENKKDVDDSMLSKMMSVFNIGKKEDVVITDDDKLKETWSEMKNEELLKLFTDYTEKAKEYVNIHKKHGDDHRYSLIIYDIIQSRSTDVNS